MILGSLPMPPSSTSVSDFAYFDSELERPKDATVILATGMNSDLFFCFSSFSRASFGSLFCTPLSLSQSADVGVQNLKLRVNAPHDDYINVCCSLNISYIHACECQESSSVES